MKYIFNTFKCFPQIGTDVLFNEIFSHVHLLNFMKYCHFIERFIERYGFLCRCSKMGCFKYGLCPHFVTMLSLPRPFCIRIERMLKHRNTTTFVDSLASSVVDPIVVNSGSGLEGLYKCLYFLISSQRHSSICSNIFVSCCKCLQYEHFKNGT